MKRVISLLLAVLLTAGCSSAPSGPTVVRGVIGSEKQDFFADPQVVRAFAQHGLDVQVDPAGSRQIATSVELRRSRPPPPTGGSGSG
jgi:PBP1b-binding outer membrane lipoprotein LpoB